MTPLTYSIKSIKCHLSFLLNKRNIIVLLLFNVIFVLLSLYSSSIYLAKSILDSKRTYYLLNYNENFFLFLRIIYLIIVVFLTMNYFSESSQKYKELMIINVDTKVSFYITKYITIYILFLVETLFVTFIYYFILRLVPYYDAHSIKLDPFIDLYIVGIYYSLLTNLFLNIFKTDLSSLFSIILYWVSFILNSMSLKDKKIVDIFLKIVPVFRGFDNVAHFDYRLNLLLILTLLVINIFYIYKSQ